MNLIQKRTFFNWFQTTRLVYPPKPSAFTTGNRIYENYVTSLSELQTYLLAKQPTILNLTTCDERCNKYTLYLHDVLSDSKKYPNSIDINMVNVLIDYGQESNEILYKYSVNGPCLLLLKSQLVQDKLIVDTEEELLEWIKNIDN